MFCPAPGRAGRETQLPSSSPPKGRAERRAFYRARGATWVNHVASCAFRAHDSVCRSTRWCCRAHGNGLGRSAYACVPHANGFRGLLHVPGSVTGADAVPFVRAVARTCTWAVRPCCRRLSLHPPPGSVIPKAAQGSGIVAATAPRYPRRGDDRNAPRQGAGWPIHTPGRRTKQEQSFG